MAKNKRLGVSVFVVILTIIMALSVIFTFSISYMFSSDGVSGKLFGKYIYIMDTADMTPEIDKGSAVIADEDGIAVLIEGNVILFKNGKRENVMRIREVVHNTDSTIYRVSPDTAADNTLEVSKDNVIAKCTTESHNLGVLISFLSSMPGIIIGMLLPCFVILALLIMKIIAIRKSDNEEDTSADTDFDDDDDDDEFKGFNGHQVKPISSAPLFNPESDLNPGEDFERKKSSIAQNFSQKPCAAPRRPARKPQQNFPKAAVERFKAAVDEKPNAPVSRKPTLVPESSNPVVSEKLAAIKAALSQQESQENSTASSSSDNNSAEKTATFKAVKPQQSEPAVSRPAARKPEPVRKAPSRTSNINSIDDLIKALEEEKKKL